MRELNTLVEHHLYQAQKGHPRSDVTGHPRHISTQSTVMEEKRREKKKKKKKREKTQKKYKNKQLDKTPQTWIPV